MGIRSVVAAVVVVAAALLAAPTLADDDALAPFRAESATPVEIVTALLSNSATLAGSPLAATSGSVTVCSTDEDGASKLADAVAARVAACTSALADLGWAAPTREARLLVVHVRSATAPSVVVSAGAGRVFWRQGRDTVPAIPSVARPDGLTLRRDVLVGAERCRTWAAAAAATARHGSASLDDEIARHAVAAVLPARAAPEWFREGLACWLSETTGGPPAAAPHCRAWLSPPPAVVATILTSPVPPPGARPWMARVAGLVVAGATDGPARVATLASKPGLAGVEAVLGKPLAAALAADTVAPTPTGAAAPRCDEQGAVPCPVCRGRSNVDVECDDCAGAGSVSCPSCGGHNWCPYCDNGTIELFGRSTRCDACRGFGVKLCKACAGKWKMPCRRCSGSGKLSVPCLACANGSIDCPEGGAALTLPLCRWCDSKKPPTACETCLGIGWLGCRSCLGSGDWFCHLCGSKNGRHMNSICEACKDITASSCPKCVGQGRQDCPTCRTSGKSARDPAKCTACRGTSQVALRPNPPLTAEEAEQSRTMLTSALAFLERCWTSKGYALRDLRRGALETCGDLRDSTPYSNAAILWVLATAGGERDSTQVKAARTYVEEFATRVAAGDKNEYAGTQVVSHSLRALLATGTKPSSPVVQGLVKRLVKGQRNGLWPGDLDDLKEPPSAFEALFAAEALRSVRLAGGKVPGEVWQKLLAASSGALEKRDLVKKKGWVSGTDIVSAAALAVIAKEGTLGAKATSFDYRSLPQVKSGLAWMDRRFAVETEPIFVDGARLVHGSDAGQSSWLFAVQRLSMLLSIQNVGGADWHAAGIRALMPVQYKDGSFEERSPDALNGPVRTTLACILFLIRATPAVTDSNDE